MSCDRRSSKLAGIIMEARVAELYANDERVDEKLSGRVIIAVKW